jgi:translation initiation factor IF-3
VGFRRRRWRDVAPEKDKVRVNRAIRVPEVRVVNEDGQQLGVMPTDAARDIAARIGLDLVEISPNGTPPVCKIMDYGRFKYEQKKKAATAKRSQHQSQLKEIKLRPQIDEHDLAFKLRAAERFLLEGDKVKATVTFRGREMQYQQIGRDLLTRVVQRLAELAKAESSPQMEGRMLSLILAPDRAAIKKIMARQQSEAEKAARAAQAEEDAKRAALEAEEEEDEDDDDLDDEVEAAEEDEEHEDA